MFEPFEQTGRSIKEWAVRNKKGLMIFGGIALASYLGYEYVHGKNSVPMASTSLLPRERTPTLIPEIKPLPDILTVVSDEMRVIARNGCIRNLPEGWNASAAKLAQAAGMGIELSGQTIVDPCNVNLKRS